jgi:hypothetical protein
LRTRRLVVISLVTLLATCSVYAQSRSSRVKISFPFSAGGKQFPAGQYFFAPDDAARVVKLTSVDGKANASIPVLTRTARAIHTTPADTHVVFDKVGQTPVLSELWIPGRDGYVLNAPAKEHEHEVVDAPVSREQ